MLEIRIKGIGEVVVYIDDIFADGTNFLYGHDEKRNKYVLKCAHISWQEDYAYEYGWAHVVEYSLNGNKVACDFYSSIG